MSKSDLFSNDVHYTHVVGDCVYNGHGAFKLVIDGVRSRAARYEDPVFMTYNGEAWVAFSDYWLGTLPAGIKTNTAYRLSAVKR